MEKYLFTRNHDSRDSAADSALTIKEKPCNGRARPRLSGRSLISPWLDVERCLVGFDRLKCTIITL